MKLLPVILALTSGVGSGGGAVSVEKGDVLVGSQSTLNFIEGSNISLTISNDTGNSEIDITISATGSIGAPSDATYVVMGAHANLDDERVFTDGVGIKSTDDGISTVTVDLSYANLGATTEDLTTSDLLIIGDASDTNIAKKITAADFITELSLVVTSDLSGYSTTSHNHTGVYATAAHNHSGVYLPAQTIGIADDNLLEVDQVGGAAANEYARFTAAGIESRSVAEVLSDIGAAAASHTHTMSEVTDAGALATLDAVTVTEIGARAVTFAKTPAIAQDRMLGRITTGAGDIEELTAAQVRAFVNVENAADVTDFANVSAALAAANSAVSFNSQQITNVADPTTAQMVATKAYVDANIGGGAVDVSGTPLVGDYARWVDADTLEARTTAQVLSDIGASASSHNHAGVYQPIDAVLSDLAGLTLLQGDILYFDGANLVALGAGTSGQFLKTLGTGANPLWDTIGGGGDMLASNNLSDVAAAQTAIDNLFGTSGRSLRTGVTNTDTVLLQAYDVDGASYTTFATLTAGNTPTFDLASGVTLGGSAILTAASSVDAATLDGIDSTGFALSGHNHSGTYLPNQTIGIADNNLVEIDGTPASGQFARFTATGLEGRTTAQVLSDIDAAASGHNHSGVYATVSHSHATTDITSGTFADARIAESNVTQHQAALSITESQISDLGVYGLSGGQAWTGAHDFGGATSLEIPNGAAPVVNATGEIALDTSVADWSHGIVKYYDGTEELALVALPIAELTTPTDGYVVAYNAANDEFELVANGAGSGLSNAQDGSGVDLEVGIVASATTNAPITALTLYGRTSGTAADGLGVGIDAYIENDVGTDTHAASIDFVWDDVTDTTEDARIDFYVAGDGAAPTRRWYMNKGGFVESGGNISIGASSGIELNNSRHYSFSGTGAGQIKWLTDTGLRRGAAGLLRVDDTAGGGAALEIGELSAAKASTAAFGQFWVKDNTPNDPMFTDDAGNDRVLEYAGKQTISVPATGMTPTTTSGAAAGSAETTTNKVMIETYDFDAAADEKVQFTVAMPTSWDGGTVTAIFHWTHGSTATNFGVAWAIRGLALGNSDAFDTAFGTAVVTVDDGLTTDDLYISGESNPITISNTPAAGDLVVFEVYRDVSDAGDDLAVDAKLVAVQILYTTDAPNDN